MELDPIIHVQRRDRRIIEWHRKMARDRDQDIPTRGSQADATWLVGLRLICKSDTTRCSHVLWQDLRPTVSKHSSIQAHRLQDAFATTD